jgi:predicted outer membrane protein
MTAARFTSRPSRWVVGISAMALAFLLAPASPARADANIPGIPDPQTSFNARGSGSVSAADKDFVIKVRLAGLWEIAAGNMAQEKSDDPRIVEIGKSIATQHVLLDKLDRVVAKELGIDLPNQPNADQQSWLAEMRNAQSAAAFDQSFIDRLRAAHGKIFPAIATVRASTRNDAVRALAQQANQFVMTHMTLLESSGIVDYGSLPTAPAPAPATSYGGPVPVDGNMVAAANTSGGVPGLNTTVILLVLAAALVAGVITTMRIFRAR